MSDAMTSFAPSPATLMPPVLANQTAGELAGTRSLFGAVSSDTLLQGQKAVEIIHHGTVYRLQATKLGKLILTK